MNNELIFSGLSDAHTLSLMRLAKATFAKSGTGARKFLQDNGKRVMLGSGRFACAFSYGRDKVIKTNATCIREETEADAQSLWLEFAIENQHLPWVPEIHFAWINRETREYFVVMEKLASIERVCNSEDSSDDEQWVLRQPIGTGIWHGASKKQVRDSLKTVGRRVRKSVLNAAMTFTQLYLDDARTVITDIKRETGAWIDLHSGNYMFRGGANGPLQMVITDPLVQD